MRKVIKALLIILLIAFIGIDAYLGYRFFDVMKFSNELQDRVSEKTALIEKADEEIAEFEQRLSEISQENKEAYTEYVNWQRHNEYLKEVLDRQD